MQMGGAGLCLRSMVGYQHRPVFRASTVFPDTIDRVLTLIDINIKCQETHKGSWSFPIVMIAPKE